LEHKYVGLYLRERGVKDLVVEGVIFDPNEGYCLSVRPLSIRSPVSSSRTISTTGPILHPLTPGLFLRFFCSPHNNHVVFLLHGTAEDGGADSDNDFEEADGMDEANVEGVRSSYHQRHDPLEDDAIEE
jgi:hypothetical protein